MTLRAVFFDVGETLVNEERYWCEVAAAAKLDVHVVLAALGVTIARGEDHLALWSHLGVQRPDSLSDIVYVEADLYPDAVPCLDAVRELGLRVGLAGNQSEVLEGWTRAVLPAVVVGSSATWGARKPELAFFERMLAEAGASRTSSPTSATAWTTTSFRHSPRDSSPFTSGEGPGDGSSGRRARRASSTR